MSSQILAECLEQFGLHGLEAGFMSYFDRMRTRLLASSEVACGLVVFCTQDDERSEYAFQILSLLLEEARMGLENDMEYAEGFLKNVEIAVQSGVTAGAVGQEDLMIFASLFQKAGLQVPQTLKFDPDNLSVPSDVSDTDPAEVFRNIVDGISAEGGTAYDLFEVVSTMLAAAPEEIQAGFGNHIAVMEGPFLERCALFMLLSGNELTQEAIVSGLFERLDTSALSTETLTLLPMIRGWFSSGPVQTALDKVISKARRKAASVQSLPKKAEIREIIASIVDGVGAQNITIRLKQGTESVLAMILLKSGHGIKDAYIIPAQSDEDVDQMLGELRIGTDANDISVDTLRVLLEGALADGLENARLPAPGFLDVIEACSLFELRPQELDLPTLLNLADPERKIQNAAAQAVGRWIYNDIALGFLEPLTECWFEDSEETRIIIASGQTTRSVETKLRKFLDTRRDIWARRFLQTAVILRDNDRPQEWRTLTSSAYGLMNGRALKRIPLMESIMYTTIAAANAKLWDVASS